MMKGLAAHTELIFEKVASLPCITPYTLVGGTALSLQLHARKSEDLDFQKWAESGTEKMEVDWPSIEKELSSVGTLEKRDILDSNHVEFYVSGVKISFYANSLRSPIEKEVPILNNIIAADYTAIGAMKMEVMLRRSTFRDYYDLYCLLKEGIDINLLINKALSYSGHRLHKRNLLAMITNGSRFQRDEKFEQLEPIYNVTSSDIEAYIRSLLV